MVAYAAAERHEIDVAGGSGAEPDPMQITDDRSIFASISSLRSNRVSRIGGATGKLTFSAAICCRKTGRLKG